MIDLLSIPSFADAYARGMRDVNAGRTRPWCAAMYRVELSREAHRFYERSDKHRVGMPGFFSSSR